MGRLKKRVISILLALVMTLGLVLPAVAADSGTVIVGESGSIPGDFSVSGSGGLVGEQTTFFVGIGSESYIGGDKLIRPLSDLQVRTNTISHYKNHYPKQDLASIIFAPSGAYNTDYAIATANLSDGSLDYVTTTDQKYLIRKIEKEVRTSIYYSDILAAIGDGKKDKLAYKKWQKVIPKDSQAESKAVALWSFILQDGGANIDTNLAIVLKATILPDRQSNRAILASAWLDLVISLYTLSPPGSQQRKNIGDEIEKYLKEDDTRLSNPPHISIQTGVLVHVHTPKGDELHYMYMSSVEFLHYVAGIDKKASMYLADAGRRKGKDYVKKYDYTQLIEDATADSLVTHPRWYRKTGISGEKNMKADAFAWAITGVESARISTAEGVAHTHTTDTIGVMSSLTFSGKLKGFVIALPYDYYPSTPAGRFAIKANLPKDGTTTLDSRAEIVGKDVNVNLEMAQTGKDLSDWKRILGDTFEDKFPKIKIDLERTKPTKRQADATPPPPESAANPAFTTVANWKGYNGFITIKPSLLSSLIEGKSTINYTDHTMQYPIPKDTTVDQAVEFDYTATVEIKLSESTEPIKLTVTNGTKTDAYTGTAKKTFERSSSATPTPTPGSVTPPPTPTPTPPKASYTSQPSYWSEIKTGEPNNEPFEAMAGTPTTRNLYFASGGSEFIVEAELEYVPDTEITRKYKSVFSGGVDSEFKTGDTAGSYNVPSPSGATSQSTSFNVHTGGTVSASWSYTVSNSGVANALAGYIAGTPGSPCAGNGANLGAPGDITWTDVWDAAKYNTAVTQAKNWQQAVNAYVVKFTSASDKLERTWNSWGASLSGNIWGDSITVSQWPSYTKTMGQTGSTSGYAAGNHGHGGSCPGNDKVVQAAVSASGTPGKPGYTAGSPAVYGPCGSVHSCGSFTPATKTTVTKVSDKTFTITVSANIPPHTVCGPCCTHVLPSIEDTWTQKIKFDHMKINVARVWKLDQSAVNGMTDITGTDEVKATVEEGDPNIFYNRSETNKSIDGRLRYTVETDMHDDVVWNEGPRSNKEDGLGSNGVSSGSGHSSSWAAGILYSNSGYTNEKDYHRDKGGNNTGISSTADAKDVATMEWTRFNQRRTTQNVVTVISDMLILQTSSGDQSIIYFQKAAAPKQTQENFDKVSATKEEMWDNNPLSFAKKTEHDINIGSYNGKFYNPAAKYTSYANSPVTTIFDTLPAGLIRPARTGKAMRLVNTNVDIIDTIPNGEYYTGTSTVFYRNILNYGDGTPAYDVTENEHYDGAIGAEFLDSNYSDDHSKINDIVIHNPVSAEFAMVMPQDSLRDQRTSSSKLLGGNLQEAMTETVKRLKNPLPKQNLIYNGDAEQIDGKGLLSNWKTWESNAGNTTFTKRTTPDWKISGASTFEIITNPNANYQGVYYTDTPGIGGDSYSFTGKLGAHRCQGYFYIAAMNSSGAILGTYSSDVVNNNAVIQNLSVNFTAPAGTTSLRVHIVNGNTSGYVQGYAEYVFADDLVLNDNTTTTWQSLSYTINEYSAVSNADYVEAHTISNPGYVPEHTITNPSYVPANPGSNAAFGYTGGTQTFTAPVSGTYTLEVWGAQGGHGYQNTSCYGGLGGYSEAIFTLSTGATLNIYVGAKGTDSWNGRAGGYNGGGNGCGIPYGGGGGGATDIRINGYALSDRIIVAGGGGGGGAEYGNEPGGAGGGANQNGMNGLYGGSYQPSYCGGGGTLSYGGSSSVGSPGSLGQGGNGYGQAGGGGGGYYGGGGSGSGPDGGAGGGSGYVSSSYGGVVVSAQTGIQSGNGFARITSPATPAVGSPTITIPAVGEPTILVPAQGSPTIESMQPIVYTATTAPDNWYETVEVTTPAAQPVTVPGAGAITPGNFINLDYGFQIYFPNRGNFFGDNSYGIANLTANRGKGFVDNMDTTEWTKEKYVVFDFNTIYNGVAYAAGQDIPLDIHDADGKYDFYCPLANYEAASAEVTFKVIATNGGGTDNIYAANKERYDYLDARHSGVKKFNIDLVGRIGNLMMEDSGDFRFANLFKLPKYPVSWIIPNIVKEVESNQQNKILGSRVDIRGVPVSGSNHWLNTYGLLGPADRDPETFPLTPDKNADIIPALRAQPMRVGYKSYQDIQTLGNYLSGSIQIIPYYYSLDLGTGETKQVDIYMKINEDYKPINIFGAAVPGWNPNIVYNNVTALNWDDEFERRNYTAAEQARTNAVAATFQVYDTNGDLINLPTPAGQYQAYGNNQILQLDGMNRTFIGTSTIGSSLNENPEDVFQDIMFGRQAQRWHFTTGLPSSAVAVEHGAEISQTNIDALRSKTAVLLMALDIKAIGDTYVLQYNNSGENNNVTIAGTSHNLSAIPYPIISVMSITKSATDDLEISGTH